MPIGKNSIKRVTNNGYSKVTTSSPDMENSTEVTVKAEKPKKTVKKSAPKSAPKTAAKKSAPKTKKADTSTVIANPSPEVVALASASHPDGFIRTALGDELPTYLL